MLKFADTGRYVLMCYTPTDEKYSGVVIDGGDDYAVIEMNAAAAMLIDDNSLLIDTRYDLWTFEAYLEEDEQPIYH